METASFAGVVKVIFYIILFYYIFKFAMRLLLPILLKKAVEKAEENLRQRHDSHNAPHTHSSRTSAKPRETKKVGEYVDFEEIE